MFWKKQKEINRLTNENGELEEKVDELIIELEEKDKYIKKLEEDNNRVMIKNEELCNAIRAYGDLEVQDIQIPYMINIREENNIYGKNQWGGGALLHEPKLKQKIIPKIIINYYELEE